MQTKQDIEKLLAGAGTQPNKRLGQNFLIDLNLMRLLIDEAHIHETDVVLEVGTGTGSFTEGIAAAAGKVITVEYDNKLAKIAARQLEKFENVTLINADALENKNAINSNVLETVKAAKNKMGGRLLLVANLPYSVGSCVMANLVSGPVKANAMYVTVQKEVADRMVAMPCHHEYGTLSVLMAATGNVHLLRKLPASVFWPRPQIESAMVSYTRNKKKAAHIHDMQTFRETINLFMGHRRKMLKAAAKTATGTLSKVNHWSDIFDESFVDSHKRPDEITPEQYISMANICYEQIR